MSSLRDRAAAGAAFLDRAEPDWFKRVNPETLDLAHGNLCVLGQLYGTYRQGIGRHNALFQNTEKSQKLGFVGNCNPDSYFGRLRGGWNRLTRAWKNEIEKRQAVAA